METELLGLFLKYVLPSILSMLAKYGHDEAVKLLAGKTPAQIISEAKEYDQYPAGKNGA